MDCGFMEYLLFLILILHSTDSFSTERYDYFKNNNSGNTNKVDHGKFVKQNTSAAYQITEKVDDIPDTRSRPGPVIPNYKLEKPLNFALNDIENNKDGYEKDGPKKDNNPESKNSGAKRKGTNSHKYDYNENWFETKENWKPENGKNGNDLLEYLDKDFDDSEKKTRVGFYDSVKEAFSDFKNGVWKSLSDFFNK